MAKSSSKPKGRKGKIGKKKYWIAAYYGKSQHKRNQARKLRTHVAAHPHDSSAHEALKACGGALGKTLVGAFVPKKPNTKPGYLAWRAGNTGFKRGGEPHVRKLDAPTRSTSSGTWPARWSKSEPSTTRSTIFACKASGSAATLTS